MDKEDERADIMNDYIVVCFYTKNTPYEIESEGLEDSCKMFDIPCYRKGYANRGKWVRNAAIKPEFLLEMFETHPAKDLLYLDVDARIRKYPSYFDHFDGDFGVHFLKHADAAKGTPISGTLYIKNTHHVKELIKAWAKAQTKQPDVLDQDVLAQVLPLFDHLKVVNIPSTYCHIFGIMEDQKSAVIEHLQASRCYKELMDRPHLSFLIGFPKTLGNVLVRMAKDGTIYLTQHDSAAEEFLDARCVRIPGTLRWIPKAKS